MILRGPPAEVRQSPRCNAATRDSFGDPVADLGSAILNVIEVEPTDDRSIAVNEHEEDTDSSVLLFEKRAVALWKRLEKLIAPIGPRPRKVSAVLELEGKYRIQVTASQTLELEHPPTVSRTCRPTHT